GARRRAERGELAFGTVDSWLLRRLTGGRAHVTDPSNASRTLAFDLRKGAWDDALLARLRVPRALLPEIRDSSGVVAETDAEILGAPVPVAGLAGDQQAALYGQGCFKPGMMKNTWGTGGFLLMNVGTAPAASASGLLSTVAWRRRGRTTYALEGATFVAGAAVQWLRDALGAVARADETEALAESLPSNEGVYLVPAFVGLGAPHWDADARGAVFGLTRGAGRAHFARAALEAMAYQTRDLVEAMARDSGVKPRELRVDGGAARNAFLCRFTADVLGLPVVRPTVTETTALGAAFLAGLAVGFWRDEAELAALWKAERTFEPRMKRAERDALYAGWLDAVARTLTGGARVRRAAPAAAAPRRRAGRL
ncbi:MAG TPA: FGGY-family carbohydrate kinase, partial [Planctomycetota bacterium]|nr:FGGY-family carbohydrate kinase [Planctomycetota bacterium]